MTKISKDRANYRTTSSRLLNCGTCVHMNRDGTCTVVSGKVDDRHVSDHYSQVHNLSRVDLTAETPIATSTPEPWGKPSGPGLWHVKGMMLPYYIQHISHDLMESGAAKSEQQAIAMAVGIAKKWARGRTTGGKKGQRRHVHPDVQAAAASAIAQWESKRARAHAQSASHHHEHTRSTSMTNPAIPQVHYDAWGQRVESTVDLAQIRHTHGVNGTTKSAAAMTLPELHAHMSQTHGFPVKGQSHAGLSRLHAQMHAKVSHSARVGKTTPAGSEIPGRMTGKAASAMRPGGGGRFAALQAKLESRGHPANQAKALAAFIGRRKYGAKRYQQMATAGARRGGTSGS